MSPPTSPTQAHSKPAEEAAHDADSQRDYEKRPRTNNLNELSNAGAALTPLRTHYLKKTLISLQFERELQVLTAVSDSASSTLSYLGPPFAPPPKGAPVKSFPFIRFMFQQFVLTFPFLAAAPKDFFPNKLQPFLANLMSQQLDMEDVEDGQQESTRDSRRQLLEKVEKHLALLLVASTKLIEEEEVVRLSQRDLDRLEALAKRRQARRQAAAGVFDVNIICVRTVSEKSRIRSKVHEEFIIRTRRSGLPDVYVSRRYGDFRTLSDELRKAHPQDEVRPPPNKDRTAVSAPINSEAPSPAAMSPRTSSPETNGQPMPLRRTDTQLSASSTATITAARLSREQNRLTLRSYLNGLLSSPTLSSSPVLKSFLLSSPTTLTPAEEEDARRREEADRLREEGRRRFAHEVAARVDGLRGAIQGVKHDMLSKDGLARVFATIKMTPEAQNLPEDYRAVLEWGRISLAATIFQTFIASDSGSETLASLKRIHGLMPYFVLRGILKISNPVSMIRGVLDLFLAQPFGGRSLLQRMFTGSLTEEVKALQEDIAAVQEKIDDPVICAKVRQYVYAPRDIKALYREDAAAEGCNKWIVVLRAAEEPRLNRAQIQRVAKASRAHASYLKHRETLADSDDDDGPQDEDAWLFEDLNVLAKMFSRLREKEQMISLIFEGSTSDLLKDIITIFYAPLATVYKAANIAESLGDLQTFINDLIRTVEQLEDPGSIDPQRTVQIFIDLVQRHEQSFYSFVHKVHSKGESLFDSLTRWISLFLTLVRDGISLEKISLEFILPHMGLEREAILKEVDAVALYHYKLKVAYEDKVRRRFAKTNGSVDEDDAATQAFVDGFVVDLSLGDLMESGAPDLDQDSEDEDTDDDSDEDSEFTDSSGASDEANAPRESGRKQERQAPGPKPAARARSSSKARSLRRSRSLTQTLKTNQQHETVPPVPLLPGATQRGPVNGDTSTASSLMSPTSIPLPPTPASAPAQPRTSHELARTPAASNARVQGSSNHSKRGGRVEIAQPSLQAIPSLLPLFVEMLLPHLRPRTT